MKTASDTREVLVLYYSHHGSVRELARHIAHGIEQTSGVAARLGTRAPCHLQGAALIPRGDVAAADRDGQGPEAPTRLRPDEPFRVMRHKRSATGALAIAGASAAPRELNHRGPGEERSRARARS
mgnify:CR=1 FL=1